MIKLFYSCRSLQVAYLSALLAVSVARAAPDQDYPYQDGSAADANLPEEGPQASPLKGDKKTATGKGRTPFRRQPALFRLGIKLGGNFSSIQAPLYNAANVEVGRTKVNGLGLEALFAMGWDLPYQPVFIEFESGYRRMFMNQTDILHNIVMGFGLHYRERIGDTALWKPGLKSYLECRIQSTGDKTTGARSSEFTVEPTIAVSSLFEFGSFLVEPLFYLNTLQKDHNFYSVATRVGYRF